MDSSTARGLRIAGVVVALIGLIFAGIGLLSGGDSASWPTTLGTVQEAHVEESLVHGGGARVLPIFTTIVTYEYRVAGQTYTNNRVTPDALVDQDEHANSLTAELVLARYQPGDPVQVHQSPIGGDCGVLCILPDEERLPLYAQVLPGKADCPKVAPIAVQ